MNILASALVLALMAVTGFSTTAGAAALTQRYAPAGASGTGANAPPVGSQPLYPGLWDALDYRIPHHFASCPQPPNTAQGRLSLANSPTMLHSYGLPSLTQVEDLAEWPKIVTAEQTRQCDTRCQAPARKHELVCHGWLTGERLGLESEEQFGPVPGVQRILR